MGAALKGQMKEVMPHMRWQTCMLPRELILEGWLPLKKSRMTQYEKSGLRRKMNANMLVPVPITKKIPLKDKNSACLHMRLLNAQYIWDKDGAIVDYFLSNNINIAIITESWLQSIKQAYHLTDQHRSILSHSIK